MVLDAERATGGAVEALVVDVVGAYVSRALVVVEASRRSSAAVGCAVQTTRADALVVEGVELDPAVENEEKPGRHLRVAPDSVRRRRHVRIAAAAAAVSISATLFAVVGFNVELAQHQIQLQKLQRSLQAQQTRYYELRAEVAQRSSPPQIVARRGARSRQSSDHLPSLADHTAAGRPDRHRRRSQPSSETGAALTTPSRDGRHPRKHAASQGVRATPTPPKRAKPPGPNEPPKPRLRRRSP